MSRVTVYPQQKARNVVPQSLFLQIFVLKPWHKVLIFIQVIFASCYALDQCVIINHNKLLS